MIFSEEYEELRRAFLKASEQAREVFIATRNEYAIISSCLGTGLCFKKAHREAYARWLYGCKEHQRLCAVANDAFQALQRLGLDSE